MGAPFSFLFDLNILTILGDKINMSYDYLKYIHKMNKSEFIKY